MSKIEGVNLGIIYNAGGLFIPCYDLGAILSSMIIFATIIGLVSYYFGMLPSVVTKDNCKFTARDYKWIIVLLIVIIVFLTSLYWGDNQYFAEKISFAGTLSSIILSVLAIIMTIHAEDKNDASKAQIESTKILIENAKNSIEKANNDMQGKINIITDLGNLVTTLEGTIKNIESCVNVIKDNTEQIKTSISNDTAEVDNKDYLIEEEDPLYHDYPSSEGKMNHE